MHGCAGPGPYDHASLGAALAALDPDVGGHIITVEGTCHNDAALVGGGIVGFARSLTIKAGPAGATISRDQTLCTSAPVGPGAFDALTIIDSHVQLNGLTIAGGRGVQIIDSRVEGFGLTVESSRGNGISLNDGSTLNLVGMFGGGPTPNLIQNNCGTGLAVSYGSTASLNLGNTVQGNGGRGVNVAGLASFNASADSSGQILIRNNQQQGLTTFDTGTVLVNGQVIVQNNSADPTAFFRAGVLVGGNMSVNSTGLQILDNGGAGIWVDFQGSIRLGAPPNGANVTISGNSEEGLRLTKMSAAWSFAGSTISGNTGADATCDATSYLFGDVTGIAVNKCKNTDKKK